MSTQINEKDYLLIMPRKDMERRMAITRSNEFLVWQYLYAYITRGEPNTPIWKICKNMYDSNGLLAAPAGISFIASRLKKSKSSIYDAITSLIKQQYIYALKAANPWKTKTPNIYVLGNVINGKEHYFIDYVFTTEAWEKITTAIESIYVATTQLEPYAQQIVQQSNDIMDVLMRSQIRKYKY